MKRFLQILTAIFLVKLCLITAMVGFFLWSHRKKFSGMADDARRQQLVVGGILSDTEKSVRAWKQASEDQSKLATQTLQSTNEALKKLGTTADHLQVTIDSANLAIQHIDASATQAGKDLDATSVQLQPILVNLATSSDALARKTPIILQELAVASEQSAETMKNVEGTTAQMELTAKDIHDFVHRETTPARGTWHVIKTFLGFAGPAGSMVTAVK